MKRKREIEMKVLLHYTTSSPSISHSSLKLPHPQESSSSSLSVLCSSHLLVATPVSSMNSASIVAPLGVNRRLLRIVSLVIPALRRFSLNSV